MVTPVRQKIAFIYGIIIAFLAGILGGVIANKITPVNSNHLLSFTFTVIVIAFLIYRLINDFTERLGVRKPGQYSETSIDCPFELAIGFYEETNSYFEISLRNARFFHRYFASFVKNFPISFWVSFNISFILINAVFECWIIFLPTLSLLIVLNVIDFFAVFQYKANLYVFRFARKTKSCISFLLGPGRGFLDPREFRLIIDFFENKYYFTYYEPNEALINSTKEEINRILDAIRKKEETELLLESIKSHLVFDFLD